MTNPVMTDASMVDPTAQLHPSAPQNLQQSGLSLDLVTQLVLKTLQFTGELTGSDIAARLGVSFAVIEPSLTLIKKLHQCEVVGGAILGAPSYRYRITDAGRERAQLLLDANHYVGVAPVPLAQYQQYLTRYRASVPDSITRPRVQDAFSHLVVSQRVLDQVGPAVAAGHSMFVYGPPGNGKTVLSQAIRNLLDGEIAVPHAIEVEGSIIRVYDPVNHEAIAEPDGSHLLTPDRSRDARWVRCRRPMVTVGGELTMSALDLSYSADTGFYGAPVQMVANGGVLVIDDFGRQTCSPRDLLNRWIVPLESRVDYLTLKTGQKFELPFLVMVVFATNIKPTDLVDEAFLRRIHYKVFAESPTREDFLEIFERVCEHRQIAFDSTLVNALLDGYFAPRGIAMRGCQPRDLVEQALARAKYLGDARHLTSELLEAACESYFVDEDAQPAV
jgi:predicted ATPase with chaperone activity